MNFKKDSTNELTKEGGDGSNVSAKGNSMSNLKYDEINQFHYNDDYIFFTKSWLSQWYGAFKGQDSTFEMLFESGVPIEFNCSEQAMMFHKAILFKDFNTARFIMDEKHPNKQKELGRQVRNFDEKIWDKVKFDIVYAISFAKFTRIPLLKERLMETGSKILVEAAPWDSVWGIGMGVEDPNILDKDKWRGQNLLGQALMKARTTIGRLEHGVLS
jgi:ribA/ribD-fused uncharacterized protein